MKNALKILAILIIFASCKAKVYNNSNSNTDSSAQTKSIDTSMVPSNSGSSAQQSGKMSAPYKDSSQPK